MEDENILENESGEGTEDEDTEKTVIIDDSEVEDKPKEKKERKPREKKENRVKTQDELLHEQLDDMKRRIMILEWDKERNQLNSGKEGYLNKLREDYNKLKSQLNK